MAVVALRGQSERKPDCLCHERARVQWISPACVEAHLLCGQRLVEDARVQLRVPVQGCA